MGTVWEIKMPQLGADDEPVVIDEWLVTSGEKVAKGQVIAALELDKTTMELECNFEGYIFIIAQPEDFKLPGEVIAIIADENNPPTVKS